MKNKTIKCKNCGKAFTPGLNGADDNFGPECIKQFLFKEIQDLEDSNTEIDLDSFLDNKTYFNAKSVSEFLDSAKSIIDVKNDVKTNTDEFEKFFDELDSVIEKDTKEEIIELNNLVLKVATNGLSVKELIGYVQKFDMQTVSDLASAIFVHKYSDKISHNIVKMFNESGRLMLAKNMNTTKVALEQLALDENSKVSSYAKMTLNIKKHLNKVG